VSVGACYRGSRGPQGTTGPQGEPGPQGDAGADGQASSPTLATPGATPAESAADLLWPPAGSSLPYPSILDVEIRATATRPSGATRDLQLVVKLSIDALGGVTIKGQTSSETPLNHGGWTGTASLGTVTAYVDDVRRHLRIPATANGAGVTWPIDGAYLRKRLL
jgi:hypothetical protein